MSVNYVKWVSKARSFFENAADDSVELLFVVSHGCRSQTGKGFEELVNTINRDDIKRKVKKFTILDASYLYRHCYNGFSALSSPDVKSMWFINNESYINRLKVDVAFINWIDLLNSPDYDEWYKQIDMDFRGDKDGFGIVQEFRNSVLEEAGRFAESQDQLDACVQFILEERAISCAFHKNTVIVYPIAFRNSMKIINERYNLNITQLAYRLSDKLQSFQRNRYETSKIEKEVILLLVNAIDANFFAIDKYGEYIYKNEMLSKFIGDLTHSVIDPDAWRISKEIMDSGKAITLEEKYIDKYFLSIKAPLIIDDVVEGVVGVSVDITDKKRAEELKRETERQKIQIEKHKEFKNFTAQLAHDIMGPLASLEMFISRNNLPEREHISLRDVIAKIRSIGNLLVSRYKEDERLENNSKEQHILVSLALKEAVEQKSMQLINSPGIKINYIQKRSDDFAFIMGNNITFGRMIFNLLDNAVESIQEGRNGIVDVELSTNDDTVSIMIKDNGCGIPKDLLEKIRDRSYIETTKNCGMGIKQILTAINIYKGNLSVESKKGEGTLFTITFPKVGNPDWLVTEINLKKGDTVVVLDDDESMRYVWENVLENYRNDLHLKFFTKHKDTEDFLESLENKEKVFLFSDYELRGQSIDGILFILQTKMQKQSMIVTSIHNENSIQERAESAKLKILPKQFLQHIMVHVK